MPKHKDALRSEVFLCFYEVLSEVFALVTDLCPHVVNHERLCEIVLVVAKRHCFEVECHHGATFNVAKFVSTFCCVAIDIEELGHRSSVFWEVGVCAARLPLLVKINNVVGLRLKQFIQFFVLKYRVEQGNLIDCWLCTFVANSGRQYHCRGKEMDLPDWRLREHHPGEGGPSD